MSPSHDDLSLQLEKLRTDNKKLSEQVKRLVRTESELYKFQEQIDKQFKLYRRLYEIGKQFNQTFDIKEITNTTVNFIIYELNFERCVVLLRSPTEAFFYCDSWDGYYDDDLVNYLTNLKISLENLVIAPLFKGAENIICQADNSDPEMLNFGRLFYLDEYVIFPLVGEGNIPVGLLIAGLTNEQFEYYTRVQVDSDAILSLGNLASQTSIALNNAQLFTYLQTMDKLKDEFLANTSHELRTPLNGIIGIAESLIDGVTGQLPTATLQNLAMVVASGRRLANLVNDILDFSKLRHKNIELQLKPVGIREIVEVVLTLSQPLIGAKKLKLVNTIARDLPPTEADENRLQQIFHNLIGNAIKFTQQGKVEVSAKLISLEAQGKQEIEITVSDTGIGIPTDKLTRIFESFEQVEGAVDREYSGTGLGLAITKKLIELHQGHIRVESSVGKGSKFIFTLPVCLEQLDLIWPTDVIRETTTKWLVPTQLPVNYQTTLNNPIDGDNIKILIVDDEPINLQVLANHLAVANYTITQFANGQEALQAINQNYKPDLILLDVMMPRMTGYEVTKKIREKFSGAELPIILLTAKNQVKDLVMGFNVGANDYLTKPIAKDELLARIKTHLNLSKLRAENYRLSTELDITRKLQQMILPKPSELSEITDLEIVGFMEPATEVGGDYYDVFTDNNRVKISIGDVTGHGLESGVLMIMVQTAVRTLLATQETDYVKFFQALNQAIYNNVQRMEFDKNITLILLDYQDGMITITGQHEEVIIVRSGGALEKIDTIDLGFPIGLDNDISNFINSQQIALNSGDILVLYTDGITEAPNEVGVQYSLSRLCEVVQQHWQLSAEGIKDMVIDDVRSHIGLQKVYDDITLLIIKKK